MGIAHSRQEKFWEACGYGRVDEVRNFLKGGNIDVNWVSYTHDCSPIHVASQGKPEIVQMLLDANCDVNVQDNRGNTALHHAAMKGHADIIQTLIDAGAKVNITEKSGWSPLHCAAYWSHPNVITTLLKNGIDVHLKNKDQRTALHETARSLETDDRKLGQIARELIAAGSDINSKSSDEGEADFTGLMFAAYHNHPEVASALTEVGCDLDACGTNQWTALHWAADREHDELVYLLLEAGADPTKKGERGELAADRAQSTDIQEILMNAANMFRELSTIQHDSEGQTSIATEEIPLDANSPQNQHDGESDLQSHSEPANIPGLYQETDNSVELVQDKLDSVAISDNIVSLQMDVKDKKSSFDLDNSVNDGDSENKEHDGDILPNPNSNNKNNKPPEEGLVAEIENNDPILVNAQNKDLKI